MAPQRFLNTDVEQQVVVVAFGIRLAGILNPLTRLIDTLIKQPYTMSKILLEKKGNMAYKRKTGAENINMTQNKS